MNTSEDKDVARIEKRDISVTLIKIRILSADSHLSMSIYISLYYALYSVRQITVLLTYITLTLSRYFSHLNTLAKIDKPKK